MSEKRFKRGDNLSCVDTETGKSYWYACNLCGLLNEKQATLTALKEENEQLRKENENLKQQVILAQKGRNVYMKALLER